MMRGPEKSAMAVRKPDGHVDIEIWSTFKGEKPWHKKAPFLRGIFNLVDSMKDSYRCLLKSADLAGMEQEPSEGFERWLADKLGERLGTFVGVFAVVVSVVLALLLFMVVPTVLLGFMRRFGLGAGWLSLIEAFLKIAIFVAYLAAISRMPDIQRVFEYHGAEHKTIACYEGGRELTVENVAEYPRFHPRCGTSFLLIVVLVSVAIFSVVTWNNLAMRIVLKLLSLPLVVGIAYEIIKIAGRYDNALTRAVSAPGLVLQRLTTREPDAMQIEVAIASMRPCIPEDLAKDAW
jgi:uncharacterized protein YqhQ